MLICEHECKALTMDQRFSFKSEFEFQARKFPITIKILGGCSTQIISRILLGCILRAASERSFPSRAHFRWLHFTSHDFSLDVRCSFFPTRSEICWNTRGVSGWKNNFISQSWGNIKVDQVCARDGERICAAKREEKYLFWPVCYAKLKIISECSSSC